MATKLERQQRYRRERQEWLASLKSTLRCANCQENHPACLQFHHVTGDKKAEIGRMILECYSMDTILKELEKCEVLCANCHAKLHHSRP